MRDVDLGKPEGGAGLGGYCGYCGTPVPRAGGKFCSKSCYHQKRKTQPAEQRFWGRVDRSGECWLWTGGVWNSGYGQFRAEGGRTVGAHRFSYELANGPIPDGLEILHLCDTPLCVRPDHLMVGTHLENVQDAAAKGKYRVHRPTGQKLTAEQIKELRRLVLSGEKQFRAAERFGVSEGYVSQIMSGVARQYDAPMSKAV